MHARQYTREKQYRRQEYRYYPVDDHENRATRTIGTNVRVRLIPRRSKDNPGYTL